MQLFMPALFQVRLVHAPNISTESLSGVPLVSVSIRVLEPDIPQLRSLHSTLENIRARLMIKAGMLTTLSGFFKFNFCTINILQVKRAFSDALATSRF